MGVWSVDMCMNALPLFQVQSVVVVGASEEAGRIGSGLYKSMASSFSGPIYCVNPRYDTLWGQPCYKTVLDLPQVPSHAVIAVARKFVPDVLRQCVEKGITNVVVISSGFKETDEVGAQMEREMAALCAEHNITLLGPNTLGFIDTSVPYNGTFLPDTYMPGNVSVISQSGGVGMSMISALADHNCGINKWIGIGNEAVLDAVALLRYLADDPTTAAIGVCFEGLRNLPEFLHLARQVNRRKPIVLLRDGKGKVGMQAAASHTGTMATGTAVMSGLIRQFGLTEARTVRECAAMLKALSVAKAPPKGDRAVFLTNTAGPAILAADAMDELGVQMPTPSQALQDALDQAAGVAMQLKNPADISSHSLIPKNYGIAAHGLLSSDEFDILLGFFSLSSHLILPDHELIDAVQRAGKPAVACFLGTQQRFAAYDRKTESYGIPCFCNPNDAAAAVAALVNWGKAAAQPERMAESVMTPAEKAAVESYLAGLQGGTLSEQEARKLLQLAGVPLDLPVVAASAEEAVTAADAMGYPVVLKLHSHVITHKSDVGGVRVGLADQAALKEAYKEMLPQMRQLDPNAKLTVQKMHKEGFELILGAVRRAGTGVLIMAGMGGVYSEVLQDTAFRMVPADQQEALDMLESLRCAPILRGFRGEALDCDAAATLLARISELMASFPRIRELDINPCRVYGSGIAVLDARVVLENL